MHRCGSGFLLTLAIISSAALTGCLGKSASNSSAGVSSVILSPSGSVSLNVGTNVVFSATGKNATGGSVLGLNIQYVVSSGSPTNPSNAPAPISIANNGNACAGTWDSSISICNPGTTGVATIYAVINGVFSAPTVVYVHQHIDNVQIASAETQPPVYDCFPQGQTWLFKAIAYSNNVDITQSVGPLAWSSTNTGVLTATPYIPPNQPTVLNQVQTTAAAPGITQLYATVAGTTSGPYPYTTCLVQAVYLQIGAQPLAGNSIAVKSGTSLVITATAVDTLYPCTGVAMPKPPLTWSTNNPEVVLFSTTTNSSGSNSATARANPGGATLTASCSPPTCNIGLPGLTPPPPTPPTITCKSPAMPTTSPQIVTSLPIYARDGLLPNGTPGYGAISVEVTPSKQPTYGAWVGTKDCQDQSGCFSILFSVTPGATPVGTVLTLPRTPNSLVFNHQSTPRLYMGSNQGLMYIDVNGTTPSVSEVSGSPLPCDVSLCGKVLTVSNDGKLAVISDGISTPSQVYIFSSAANIAPVDLTLSVPGEVATAAAFSPDQLKLFILTSAGNLYVYSTVDGLFSLSIATSATDVKFSADGSFAFVAGALSPANSISGFATCNGQPTQPNPVVSPSFDFVTTPGIPLQIFPSPDAQHVIALDPPYIDVFSASDTLLPLPDGQFVCDAPSPGVDMAPAVNFPQTVQSYNLGQGNAIPIYSQLVADGTALILVYQSIPAVVVFNVGNRTTTAVQLNNPSAVPLAASASPDGTQVYVTACEQYVDGACTLAKIHIVNTNTSDGLPSGDYQQITYENAKDQNNPNLCNGLGANAPLCVPDLVAVRPQ